SLHDALPIFGRREQAAEHADGGGLARTVGAEEAVNTGFRHGQVDVVHREQVAEALAQAAGVDGEVRVGLRRWIHGAGRPCSAVIIPAIVSVVIPAKAGTQRLPWRTADVPGAWQCKVTGFPLSRE